MTQQHEAGLVRDGSLPSDDALSRFRNEMDYIGQSGRNKSAVAAMAWAFDFITAQAARIAELEKIKACADLIVQGLAERVSAAEAALASVRADERERCAKIAQDGGFIEAPYEYEKLVGERIAAAIRAMKDV